MKPDVNQLFGNLFNDVHITTFRLLTFGNNALNNLTAANTANEYDAFIALLNGVLPALQAEVSDVDVSLTRQLGKTLTNNQVLAQFKQTMSDKEGFIAEVLGGKGTPAYLEFYPTGISEYTGAAKQTMPTLTDRVNSAATAYTLQLGATVTALLKGFKNSWQTSRDEQEQQKGAVSDNRTERTAARTEAEIALLQVVHGIAEMRAPDIEKCTSLLTFSLLFVQTKHKHQLFNGSLTPREIEVVTNHTLKDSMTITARNTDENAPWCLYLEANSTAEPPANAITLQPDESKEIKPSQLGDLQNTFLLIKSLSDVNDGSYQVEITGMKGKGDEVENIKN